MSLLTTRGPGLFPGLGFMVKGGVRAGWPVTADTLRATGDTANWLLARGVPLVIDGGHYWSGTGVTTRTLNYRYFVDDIHTVLGATIMLSAPTSVFVTLFGQTYLVGSSLPVIIHLAIPNLAGSAEVTWALPFTWDATVGPLQVNQVSLYECPQLFLPTAGDNPPAPKSQVYDGWDTRDSIAGVARAVEELRGSYYRRGTLFNYARGDVDGRVSTSTSYEPVFVDGSCLPALQTRMMYAGEVTRDVACNVFARVSAGGSGSVELTMANGDTASFAVTSDTDTWHTTQVLAVATDDVTTLDTDGGLRGGVRDTLQVSIKVGGVGQTVYLRGVSIWDPPG